MRRIVEAFGTWTVGLAVASGIASAQGGRNRADDAPESKAAPPRVAQADPRARGNAEAPPLVEDPEKARELDAILKKWEEKSATITQLDATFQRVDTNLAFKKTKKYEGRALLKAPNLACLNLDEINPDAQVPKKFHERILCTGDDVVQYDGKARQIIIYPLDKGQKQRALQQGPLPFLFDMKVADVKKRYQMTLMIKGRDAYRIKIVPKEEIDRDAFAEALLDLNRQTFLPDALLLTSPNEKDTQTYRFTKISTDKPVADDNFKLKKIEGWKIVRNPAPGSEPAQVGNPKPVGAPDRDPREAAKARKGIRPR